MTVALQIRGVPEATRDILTEEARQRHQSLQGLLLDLVIREAHLQRNKQAFDQTAGLRIPLDQEWSPETIIREGRDSGFDLDRSELA